MGSIIFEPSGSQYIRITWLMSKAYFYKKVCPTSIYLFVLFHRIISSNNTSKLKMGSLQSNVKWIRPTYHPLHWWVEQHLRWFFCFKYLHVVISARCFTKNFFFFTSSLVTEWQTVFLFFMIFVAFDFCACEFNLRTVISYKYVTHIHFGLYVITTKRKQHIRLIDWLKKTVCNAAIPCGNFFRKLLHTHKTHALTHTRMQTSRIL